MNDTKATAAQFFVEFAEDVQAPPQIPAAACVIIQYLEHISQEHYCAHWMTDIEHSIWEHLINPDPQPTEEDMFWDWPGAELGPLRKLAADCKGWVRFNDKATDLFDSRLFVPMDEWVKLHAEHTGKEMTEDQRNRFETFMSEPERTLRELTSKREKLRKCAAAVALAIQASGQIEVHHDLIEIMKMIPEELRCCVECGTHPGDAHRPKCKLSLDSVSAIICGY
jgi:succinate dehydrogenase flavin-adding protein (antitoxin of CptAB toxin-antitoxin module)